MGGRQHIGLVLGWLILATPAWASNWAVFKIQEPSARWEIVSLPLSPAPLETSLKPLRFEESPAPFWSYPTEVEFVTDPVPPHHSVWVAEALDKYRIHLISPFDLPYTLIAKAPLTIR